ncbi:hypothetical protein IE53DRAFT_389486 [Violaceomyces palustris]|uniref:Uncharacterized protein n=1 Tax=Violaceomyces palustris TaxID=1673888 RepID=A0ACD0NR79_9BASI|nr:hypothetical protein IE53DRAFT_389486 [Violaceomyces palustris]
MSEANGTPSYSSNYADNHIPITATSPSSSLAPPPTQASTSSPSSSSGTTTTTSTNTTTRRRRSSRSSSTRSLRPRATSNLSAVSDTSLTSGISGGASNYYINWNQGQSYNYLQPENEISDYLKCPICLGPFIDPYVSSTCNHTFCKDCIYTALISSRERTSDDGERGRDGGGVREGDRERLGQALPSSSFPFSSSSPFSAPSSDPENPDLTPTPCPTCRTKVTISDFKPTALLIKNMVDSLMVKCPNASKGCGHSCERHLLKGHVLKDCEFEYVDENRVLGRKCKCKEKVMRKDWAKHELVCRKRKVECEVCGEVVCFDEREAHSLTCSPEPKTCEHCYEVFTRGTLPIHLNDCQQVPTPCPFFEYGCTWIGPKVLLGELESDQSLSSARRSGSEETEGYRGGHLCECPFRPLKEFLERNKNNLASLQRENSELRRKVQVVEARERGLERKVEDCIRSLGCWYRSSGFGGDGGGAGGYFDPSSFIGARYQSGNGDFRLREDYFSLDRAESHPRSASHWEGSFGGDTPFSTTDSPSDAFPALDRRRRMTMASEGSQSEAGGVGTLPSTTNPIPSSSSLPGRETRSDRNPLGSRSASSEPSSSLVNHHSSSVRIPPSTRRRGYSESGSQGLDTREDERGDFGDGDRGTTVDEGGYPSIHNLNLENESNGDPSSSTTTRNHLGGDPSNPIEIHQIRGDPSSSSNTTNQSHHNHSTSRGRDSTMHQDQIQGEQASTLESVIGSMRKDLSKVKSEIRSLETRFQEDRVNFLSNGMETGRALEEINSLRHVVLSFRLQIHQIIMHQQRNALFPSNQPNLHNSNGNNDSKQGDQTATTTNTQTANARSNANLALRAYEQDPSFLALMNNHPLSFGLGLAPPLGPFGASSLGGAGYAFNHPNLPPSAPPAPHPHPHHMPNLGHSFRRWNGFDLNKL